MSVVIVIVGLVLWQLTDAMQPNAVIWSEVLLIAIASGAIACISMLPGLLALGGETNRARSESETVGHWGGIIAGVMAGNVIRMVGTVALFLTCRYHMASTIEMIVGMTIGWYVLLTSIEIIVLRRALLDVAEAPARFATPTPLKV
jgi:hypothetical protein